MKNSEITMVIASVKALAEASKSFVFIKKCHSVIKSLEQKFTEFASDHEILLNLVKQEWIDLDLGDWPENKKWAEIAAKLGPTGKGNVKIIEALLQKEVSISAFIESPQSYIDGLMEAGTIDGSVIFWCMDVINIEPEKEPA